MSALIDLEQERDGRTRRRFIGKLTAAGAAVFAGIAAVDVENAAAYPYHCCALASNTHCSGCGSAIPNGFRCPSGYRPKFWFCCERGALHHCGECTKGPDCYTGPWACSCGFEVAGPCAP